MARKRLRREINYTLYEEIQAELKKAAQERRIALLRAGWSKAADDEIQGLLSDVAWKLYDALEKNAKLRAKDSGA